MVRTANIRTHVPRRSGGSTYKTPDGLTTAKRRRTYHIGDYYGSCSPRIFQGTSSGSIFTTTVDHDFEVNQSLVLLRAGANCSVLKPAIANCSLTQMNVTGATTYRMCFSAFDGNGGQTGVGASDFVEITNGNATIDELSPMEAKIAVPYGAVSIAIYLVTGTGAISTYKFVTLLEVRNKFLASGAEPNGGGTGGMPAATIDNNGGFVRLTVPSGHGFSNGDVINFHSIANPQYNGQHVITGNTGTTLTTATAYGGATAAGWYQPGSVTYQYKGTATTLHDSWGMPTDENPNCTWRASIVRPRGNVVVNTAGTMLFRSELAKGSRITGSVEPTWPSSADSIVIDGDHTMRRCLDFVTINPPAADIPGALFTTVAAVPATNQITLTNAPVNAIASSTPYLLAHNDAPAFRAAFAAAEASGRGGTVTANGQPNLFFRKHTLDTNMSNVGSSTVPIHASLRCRSGISNASQPTVSVKLDPNCIVRAHFMQCDGLMEDMAGSETTKTYYHLFHFGGEKISIRGGAYEWQIFSGGLTEHNCSADSHAQGGSWCYDQGNSSTTNLGARPQHTLLADCRIDWPNIGASNGYSLFDNFSRRKLKARRVQFHYGGSDGDQVFSTNHGDFDVEGCEFWNTRQFGSHALYFGIDRDIMIVRACIFREVFKNSIQMRGSSGDGPVKNVIISDCIGINTGPIDIGDTTTSNRVNSVSITGCQGFNISMAEARDVSIVGGTCSLSISEDCDRIKVAHLTAGRIALQTTDVQRDIKISNVSVRTEMILAGTLTEASLFQGLNFVNPHATGTTYNGFTYAWDSCGTDEYRLKRRSNGGDPSVSSPSALSIRSNITNSPGVYQQLANDTWYYGNTEVQTITISGSPTTGSWTASYNGFGPSATIALGATAATVQTTLRTLTGLSGVTVTQTGTGNNLTYRVAMTGVVGDPPEMTSANTFNVGSIAHNTPTAYPGYDTLVVKIGDSTRYDPDENSYGTVYDLTLGPAIKFGGTTQQTQLRDIHIRKTLLDDRSTFFGNNSGSAPTLIGVLFEGVTFEHTGLAYLASGTCRMLDWGTAVMPRCEIEFFKCKWLYPARIHSAIHSEVRMAFTRGGSVTFRDCDMPCWGGTHEIVGPAGSVHLIENRIQSNESIYTCSTSADTFTHIASGNSLNLGDTGSLGMPVLVRPYGHTAMPSPLVADTIYYYNVTTKKIYALASDATSDTSPLNITTGDGLQFQLKFLSVAWLSLHVNRNDFLGDMTTPDLYGEVRGNLWRGSPVVRYATIGSNQSDYQLLPLLNRHRLSASGAVEIDGFNAWGAGSVSRDDRLAFAGSNTITIKDDADVGSVAQNRIATHGNADIARAPGTFLDLTYDVLDQVFRTIG